ncbi:MAG: type II secretion system F family protein [Planctomycetota bacterium]
MPTYKYSAKNSAGAAVTGTLDARTDVDAMNQLRMQNFVDVNVSEDVPWYKRGIGSGRAPRARVSGEDLVVFTRQISTMISAGIPLLEALEIMAEQMEDPGFQHVLQGISDKVRSGTDFSDALGEHPKIFSDIYVNMVRAGEASGELDTILTRLSEYQESAIALKREIKSAMTYPVVSLVLVIGITVFLLTCIVPKFIPIFDALNVPLPTPTRILMAISLWMQTKVPYWGGGAAVAIVGLVMYRRTAIGRWQFDWLMLRLPIFGALLQKVCISRFSRTFATLIQSGVPILGALEIVALTAGNKIIEDCVLAAMENVRQGETLAEPLSKSGIFPPMVTRMISVGERSGALEQLLEKISEFYDQQVKVTVESLTSLIEPLMIGFMGLMVGSIVLSIFLPIFKIQQVLTNK